MTPRDPVSQADRIRRQVMSNDEADRVSREYEALLDTAEAAQAFELVAYPAGKEYVEGERYAYWRARQKLMDALARLNEIRGET